ncbi:MerR family transcriptional regulator [Belnapia sp. T18]|uniref:MerR family transcriptional regulator n=1 Tax=Belnapia arida TaxID=2804533 RepID=A0ABS1UFB6_9PROT|nr:helix-turn-helix domain-containing protein [Belnapia arida]MBL6082387.1 MerR family transcriptional regulator [Belnapia arida]
MTDTEPTLAELAAASGFEPRTIRSWVAQGLLPGPRSRGPGARYPADALERLLAIRGMRDRLGMPLAAIRQELLVATPEQLRGHASRAADLAPEPRQSASAPSSALDYLRGLRERQGSGPIVDAVAPQPPYQAGEGPPPGSPQRQGSQAMPPAGFEALELRLAQARREPPRKARAEEWLRIPITPDVELAVRSRLDAEHRTRLERCADLIRDILLGSSS